MSRPDRRMARIVRIDAAWGAVSAQGQTHNVTDNRQLYVGTVQRTGGRQPLLRRFLFFFNVL